MTTVTTSDGRTDACGGVFYPIAGASVPAWHYGATAATVKAPMFTCPKFAIPSAVYQLFDAWARASRMRLPFVAGGFQDQPLIVRLSWPVFENEQKIADRHASAGDQAAALEAMAALLLGK